MPSRSRSAAGESRYSAMCAAELTLEGVCIEALWLPALFTFNQCRANRLDLRTALLLSSNEITDVFAIVGVVATFDLRLDPVILLVRQRNGLAYSRHGSLAICTNSVIPLVRARSRSPVARALRFVRRSPANSRKMPRLGSCKSLILVVREGLEPSTSAL